MLTPPVTTIKVRLFCFHGLMQFFFFLSTNYFAYSDKPDHYTEGQYAKRLIGNALSIPVITELLKPLRMIFAECIYDGYNYEFEWMKRSKKDFQQHLGVGMDPFHTCMLRFSAYFFTTY